MKVNDAISAKSERELLKSVFGSPLEKRNKTWMYDRTLPVLIARFDGVFRDGVRMRFYAEDTILQEIDPNVSGGQRGIVYNDCLIFSEEGDFDAPTYVFKGLFSLDGSPAEREFPAYLLKRVEGEVSIEDGRLVWEEALFSGESNPQPLPVPQDRLSAIKAYVEEVRRSLEEARKKREEERKKFEKEARKYAARAAKYAPCCSACEARIDFEDLKRFVKAESFSEALVRALREKDMTSADCYKKANLDRKLFSKIISQKEYQPKKKTAVALILTLSPSRADMDRFLEKLGYCLSKSNEFDLVIEWCVEHGLYDVDEVNVYLDALGLELLGSY